MLSFLPSPFSRTAPEPAPPAATLQRTISTSKRACASRGRGGRGQIRKQGRKRNLKSAPIDDVLVSAGVNEESVVPPPLFPTSSECDSPINAGPSSVPTATFDLALHHEEDTLFLETEEDELEGEIENEESLEAQRMMEEIEEAEGLYAVLGVNSKVLDKDLRRAYMARCRVVHPDKHTLQVRPLATTAFQSLSIAYETLSSPALRRAYDLQALIDARTPGAPNTPRRAGNGSAADETLNGVLRSVWSEFLDGDFEMIRGMVNTINETTPAIHVGDQTVDTIQGGLERLREALLSGGDYVRVVRFELIRLYEIQLALRQLGWFDIKGRIRLTIQLARVTLSIPLAIDKAMLAETKRGADKRPKGLLGSRVSGMLGTAVGLLEGSEEWLGGERQVASRTKG